MQWAAAGRHLVGVLEVGDQAQLPAGRVVEQPQHADQVLGEPHRQDDRQPGADPDPLDVLDGGDPGQQPQ